MEYTFSDQLFSDLCKDAHGCRPDVKFLLLWKLSSDAEKQAIWDSLIIALKNSIAAEEREQQLAVADC